MSVGGTNAAGSTGPTSSGLTTTAFNAAGTTTTSTSSQTGQANATANGKGGKGVTGLTETGDGPVVTGDPAAFKALAVQMDIAVVEAQKEDAASKEQSAVPPGITTTDPSMVQQALDGLRGFRVGVVDALQSFAERLSDQLQKNPDSLKDANKILNALPSSIAINAMVDELQAQNPAEFADLTSQLNGFLARQVTAVKNGEVSPETAGLATIAALAAAYKLAPRGALTNVVKSLAAPMADVFAAAKSGLKANGRTIAEAAKTFARDETGAVRIGGLPSNFSRDLTVADMGIKGTVTYFMGNYTMKRGVATMRVDMIQGEINNPLGIVRNMMEKARADGATALKIEGMILNERLYNALQQRYGLTSVGVMSSITLPLR